MKCKMIWIKFLNGRHRTKCNHSKCETLHFGTNLGTNPKLQHHLSGSPIPPVEKLRDLGLLVDQHLTFHYHTEYVSKKCIQWVALLFKTIISCSHQLYIDAFQTYILPTLLYCSQLYSLNSASNLCALETIQRKFTRRLYSRINPLQPIPVYHQRLKLFN